MKIPINWLKEYVNLPKDLEDLTAKLTMAGHMLDKIEAVDGQTVIDLELRGNRADCYSILGIAREVSALTGNPLKVPKTTIKLKKQKSIPQAKLAINTAFVKRVMMAVIKDVKITESPDWLKKPLAAYGVESINNIVDLTNFVMIETGEPMHAFDLEKIGKNLEIRLARKNEKLITFQDKTLTLTTEDLVWANKDGALSVAGAIGGKKHSITKDTKNVLLEAASYDRANIRRSIHRHNLFTDAGIRHEKDLDPNFVEPAIVRFLDLIVKNKWGKVVPQVSDYYPKPVKPWPLSLSFDYFKTLSGVVVAPSEITKILKLLNFKVTKTSSTRVDVLVPTYRTDVTLDEDLVEEVLRIKGYDKIPATTLSLEIPESTTPNYITQETDSRNTLLSIGFDEIISSSFISQDLLTLNKSIQNGNYSPVKVSNRPSPDIEELRMSLLPNLYSFTQKILNERGTESYLFEVGKVYLKAKSGYSEKRKIGILYCQKKDGEFVYFKGYLEAMFRSMGLKGIVFDGSDEVHNNLINTYSIKLGKEIIGYGGQIDSSFYAEIDLDSILDKKIETGATLWPKYPPQIEDITLVIPEKTKIGEVMTIISKGQHVTDIELRDTYKNSYTFRIWYQDKDKTLSDKEVESSRNKIVSDLKNKFGVAVKE